LISQKASAFYAFRAVSKRRLNLDDCQPVFLLSVD